LSRRPPACLLSLRGAETAGTQPVDKHPVPLPEGEQAAAGVMDGCLPDRPVQALTPQDRQQVEAILAGVVGKAHAAEGRARRHQVVRQIVWSLVLPGGILPGQRR